MSEDLMIRYLLALFFLLLILIRPTCEWVSVALALAAGVALPTTHIQKSIPKLPKKLL